MPRSDHRSAQPVWPRHRGVGAKAKNVPEEHRGEFGYGDVWTCVAVDAETKLVPAFLVGERNADDARVFVDDLASRLTQRVPTD